MGFHLMTSSLEEGPGGIVATVRFVGIFHLSPKSTRLFARSALKAWFVVLIDNHLIVIYLAVDEKLVH